MLFLIMNFFLVRYLMNTFLGGEFTTYGTDVISMSNQEFDKRVDPMAKVFPKVRICLDELVFSLIKNDFLHFLSS